MWQGVGVVPVREVVVHVSIFCIIPSRNGRKPESLAGNFGRYKMGVTYWALGPLSGEIFIGIIVGRQ